MGTFRRLSSWPWGMEGYLNKTEMYNCNRKEGYIWQHLILELVFNKICQKKRWKDKSGKNAAMFTCDRGCISGIYKELWEINNKKVNIPAEQAIHKRGNPSGQQILAKMFSRWMQVKFILYSPDWQKLNSSEKSSYVGTTWTSSACKGVWIGNTTQWNTLTMSRLKANTMQVCNFSPGYIPTVNYGPWATSGYTCLGK